MKVIFEGVTPEEFSYLRNQSGMKARSVVSCEIALKNTLYMVGIRDDEGKLIAFGRVVGDGATSFIVNDIMVDNEYRTSGYGKQIMQHICSYLDIVKSDSAFITLVADIPADRLYRKFGFKYLNPKTSVAMYLSK
ncbi:hypothetical protein AN641_09025 [Candidatus Epulonipiscioides gigas]|nr:hypothetical protein AN641_09025 [Epulopiscium sp. SCG-C07WGA-EpuloA2]